MFDDLVQAGLVKKKECPGGLAVYKYARKVFYDNLWNTDKRLLDARGMVLNSCGDTVIHPFTKVFNYGENGTTLDGDTKVQWVDKINGFLAAARWYRGKVIVSTTGSLSGEHVDLAKRVIQKHCSFESDFWIDHHTYTLLFEICDPSDPHIVDEAPGAWLIGARCMLSGRMASEDVLDFMARIGSFRRPGHGMCKFKDAVACAQRNEHEGFIIRDYVSGKYLMKIKTPHYLGKKWIMRMSEKKVDWMYDDPKAAKETLAEEFYGLVDYITSTVPRDTWVGMVEADRRAFIERYFETKGGMV